MYGKEPTVAPIREARFKGKGQSNGLKAGTESVCYCYNPFDVIMKIVGRRSNKLYDDVKSEGQDFVI